jgi:uncharacterized protein (DUF924 family)
VNEQAADILAFWRAAGPDKWFTKDADFDAQIRERFLAAHETAAAGALAAWEDNPDGALALVILLDQFPRNMFRGDARTFATDPLARTIAERAIAHGYDRQFALPERLFFYLPFMHAETLPDQERCVALFEAAGEIDWMKFAIEHAEIIRRFGRFPHRNQLLGRLTTADEQAFLDAGGFAG